MQPAGGICTKAKSCGPHGGTSSAKRQGRAASTAAPPRGSCSARGGWPHLQLLPRGQAPRLCHCQQTSAASCGPHGPQTNGAACADSLGRRRKGSASAERALPLGPPAAAARAAALGRSSSLSNRWSATMRVPLRSSGTFLPACCPAFFGRPSSGSWGSPRAAPGWGPARGAAFSRAKRGQHTRRTSPGRSPPAASLPSSLDAPVASSSVVSTSEMAGTGFSGGLATASARRAPPTGALALAASHASIGFLVAVAEAGPCKGTLAGSSKPLPDLPA
mmetsp:Transcript_52031/g.146607  ORF Transcript_52031/g.146607 Transcript_52031/m.146607 type:complete len:276 (+) Transcript_52031:99-926(+)